MRGAGRGIAKKESMAKEYAKAFYSSTAWRKCRAAFVSGRMAIDGGMCQYCGETTGYIVDHVDEITPGNINDPDITLNHDNLRYVCLDCHNRKTVQGKPVYRFTPSGDVVPVE